MKNSKIIKIIVFFIIIVFLVTLILFCIEKEKTERVSNSDDEIINNEDEYDKKISKLAEIEINDEKEEPVISLIENETKTVVYVTNKDVELIKVLDSDTTDEDAKEKIIENKIYAREAQKMGINLPQDEVEEIERLSNSEEILSYVKDDAVAQDNFKERLKTYLTESKYKKALKDRILDEISNNCISIEDEKIKAKMEEYISLQENFKKIENPTDEDKQNSLSQTFSLYYEIEDLYLKAIKDKYKIDFE